MVDHPLRIGDIQVKICQLLHLGEKPEVCHWVASRWNFIKVRSGKVEVERKTPQPPTPSIVM